MTNPINHNCTYSIDIKDSTGKSVVSRQGGTTYDPNLNTGIEIKGTGTTYGYYIINF